jgi:hypothetical protein
MQNAWRANALHDRVRLLRRKQRAQENVGGDHTNTSANPCLRGALWECDVLRVPLMSLSQAIMICDNQKTTSRREAKY